MATKKKTERAPRQVWIIMRDGEKHVPAAATTRKGARDLLEDDDERVVGPYVLAERARER